MTIYNDPTFSKSKVGYLAGPIEYWWRGNNFNSTEGKVYRAYRETLSRELVRAGYLVYRPFSAFKGQWNERMQKLNDVGVELSDFVLDMRPAGISGNGTEHELELAHNNLIPVIEAPPLSFHGFGSWAWEEDLRDDAIRVVRKVDLLFRV